MKQLKELIERAILVACCRSGDVDTEDGSHATTDTDEMIRLESAIQDLFDLEANELNESLNAGRIINKKLDEQSKQSFFSGLAVALQSVFLFDEPTIAQEIINGLGGDVDEFSKYMKGEGGIDGETLDWLIANGIVKGEW